MGKILSPYGGFTATDIINKATAGISTNVASGANVDGSIEPISGIKNVLGSASTSISVLSTAGNVNKWANYSSREWIPSGNVIISSPKYPYKFGNMIGYNHNAVVPTPPSASLSYPKNAGGGIINTTLSMRCKAGEYDWSKLTATHCKVIVYDGGTIFAESAIQPLNAAGNWIIFNSVPFSINTNTVYSTTYKSYIMLCQSDGNDLYYIPVEGSVYVEVVNVVTSTLSVSINGSVKVFSGGVTDVSNGSWIKITKTFNSSWGISADNLTLKSIVFTIRNSSDGSFVSSATYTSFDSNDSQQILDLYNNGDTETFQVSWVKSDRVYPTTGQYATVMMNY